MKIKIPFSKKEEVGISYENLKLTVSFMASTLFNLKFSLLSQENTLDLEELNFLKKQINIAEYLLNSYVTVLDRYTLPTKDYEEFKSLIRSVDKRVNEEYEKLKERKV